MYYLPCTYYVAPNSLGELVDNAMHGTYARAHSSWPVCTHLAPDINEVITNTLKKGQKDRKFTIIPSAYVEFRLSGEKYYPTLSTIASQSSGLTQSFPPIFHLDSLGE